MMLSMDIWEKSADMLGNISKGAFLTVAAEGKVNTMTIGWGGLSYIWQKPVCIVVVRPTRYTWELMEKTDQFTVSVPTQKQLREELGICGSKSGRDVDKIAVCQLELLKSAKIDTPLIGGCDLFYECKIVAKQDLTGKKMLKEFDDMWYPEKDYHTVYFGQIISASKKERS